MMPSMNRKPKGGMMPDLTIERFEGGYAVEGHDAEGDFIEHEFADCEFEFMLEHLRGAGFDDQQIADALPVA